MKYKYGEEIDIIIKEHKPYNSMEKFGKYSEIEACHLSLDRLVHCILILPS